MSTINVDGSERRRVTPWSKFASGEDRSPDGQRMGFVTHPLIIFSFDDVVSNLYTARPDVSDLGS